MGPLSWIIIAALVGGIAFCLFKIRAWAQALATLRNKTIRIYLKKVRGKLITILKYLTGETIEEEEIKEISDSELEQLWLDGKITYDQYIALKREQQVLLDTKYP